jgi:hypothetical protein
MIKPIEVKALKNFQLFVKFNDGIEGVIDLSHLRNGEAFKCWEAPGNFEKVYLDGQGIAWNDQLDIDALNVYLTLTKQSFEEFIRKQKHHA